MTNRSYALRWSEKLLYIEKKHFKIGIRMSNIKEMISGTPEKQNKCYFQLTLMLGMHKFSQNIPAKLKFLAPKASSTLINHKYQAPQQEIQLLWQICALDFAHLAYISKRAPFYRASEHGSCNRGFRILAMKLPYSSTRQKGTLF